MSARWLVCLLAAMAGCVSTSPAPRTAAPTTPVRRYQPPPDRYVSSVLLNFESADDAAFVDARDVRLAEDPTRPGNRVLTVTKPMPIKLGSLVRGRPFPGNWDLVGVRVRRETAATVTIALGNGERRIETTANVVAGAWKTVWIDLSTWPTSQPTSSTSPVTTSSASPLVLTISGGALLVDDVMLAQSRTVVLDTIVPKAAANSSPTTFRVQRSALQWQALFGSDIVLTLPALPFIDGGFQVVEATPTRVLFASADQSRTIAMDRTGRLIENGKTRLDPAVLKHSLAIAENGSPAQVSVVGEGRVERSLPGDRDNDGYDETRGCYAVRAVGSRVTVRLTRQMATVRWPVIEVSGLPAGAVSVWLEGQIVPTATRLPDGRVVVELPIELERPTDVQITAK